MNIVGCSHYESLVVRGNRCYDFIPPFGYKDITPLIEFIELLSVEDEGPDRVSKMAIVGGLAISLHMDKYR